MSREKLLQEAKHYFAKQEQEGEDWQAIVWEILNSPRFAPLWEGLTPDQKDALCDDIILGD